MVEFGGFEMPVSYSSIKEEHHCVRQKLGVFDVSHMGEFFVEGPNALIFFNLPAATTSLNLYQVKHNTIIFPTKKEV